MLAKPDTRTIPHRLPTDRSVAELVATTSARQRSWTDSGGCPADHPGTPSRRRTLCWAMAWKRPGVQFSLAPHRSRRSQA